MYCLSIDPVLAGEGQEMVLISPSHHYNKEMVFQISTFWHGNVRILHPYFLTYFLNHLAMGQFAHQRELSMHFLLNIDSLEYIDFFLNILMKLLLLLLLFFLPRILLLSCMFYFSLHFRFSF